MFEGLDMSQLMAQAQQLQADMVKAQEEQAAKTFTGESGAGLVTVTITGSGELTGVDIKPEACEAEDVDMLSALIVAAFRSAKEEADTAMKDSMPNMPEMPPGLGF